MNASKHFSDEKFWSKTKRVAKKAGTSVIYAALLLYYVLKKPNIPLKAKSVIVGALGYFIFPLDLIPDVTPGVGFTDDIAMLISALITVSMYVDDEVKQQAKEKLTVWFGENIDTSDIDNKLNDSDSK